MANLLNVDRPTTEARSTGLKSVVDFTTNDRLGAAEGIEWEAAECGFPSQTRAGCMTGDDFALADKAFDGISTFEGISKPFAQYAGVACWLGDDYAPQAEAKLVAGEERLVEGKLWEWAAVGAGTATSALDAVAELELDAANNYVGTPILLLRPDIAVKAAAAGALVVRDGGKLFSALGAPVVTSGAFEGAAIVGKAVVHRTAVVVTPVINHTKNIAEAIAEAVYAVGIDCGYRKAVTL